MTDLATLMQRYAEIEAKQQEYAPIIEAIAEDRQATREQIAEALGASGFRQVAGSGFMAIMQRRNAVDLVDPQAAMVFLEEQNRLSEFMVLNVARYRSTFGNDAPGLRSTPQPTLIVRRDKTEGA